ncbi:Abi family protein [Rhodococcus olei]|uniref:Abi family protein n=1 Tax=Rhodococcus olei TaxID=2161675 RepID=A0ABP8NVL2_9NOCA
MPNRSTALVQSLTTLLTPERLAPYKAAASGDTDRALDLYEWNGRISAAVFEDLGYLEVVLRNACHHQLHIWHQARGGSDPWYLDPVFTAASQEDIRKARQRATRAGRTELPGRVVAELMFGFWRFLHARSYEATLWTPCLRLAFPHLQPRRRQTVYTRLDHLNTLRNRIAHHEPVHGVRIAGTGLDVAGLHAEMLEVLGWIDPVVENWVRARSAVPALLTDRP